MFGEKFKVMEGVELSRNSCNTVDCKSSPCERTPRAARRRRMEIRRLKLIASSGSVAPVECFRKRLKLADSADSFVARDCANAVESSGRSHASRVQTLPFPDSQNEVSFTRANNTGRDINKDDDKPPGGVQSGVGLDDGTYCRHGMVSECGSRREMEDAVTIVPVFASCTEGTGRGALFNFYGVYDGHGGSQAALFCKDRLHLVLAEEMKTERSINGGYSEAQWKKMMKSCFLRVDAEVVGLPGDASCQNGGQSPASETVGSTAVVAVVGSDQIIVANCGDSRAVLCRGGKPVVLSADHKPERPDEMARIEAAGGRVIFWNGYRVLGVLAMSRAIGDKYLKPYVIGEPETTYTRRTDDDECLILASDGLWDVLSNELACEIARKCLRGRLIRKSDGSFVSLDDDRDGDGEDLSPSATAAALLAKLAMARGSRDNISVVVVDLKWHRHPNPSR